MKKLKKGIALTLIMCVLCSIGAAAGGPNITVRAANGYLSGVSYTFDIDLDTGYVMYDAQTEGVTGVSNVYVAIVIQRYINGQWVNVPGSFLSKTTSSSNVVTVGSSRYVEKGYWYRSQATFVATKNGTQTRLVQNSDQYWYN